jgi:hypothetical protein
MPPIRTLEDLELEVASLPFETLMRRYAECAKGGHVWCPLHANPFGSSQAEYCAWCFRVRIGGFEGWLTNPPLMAEEGRDC